MHHPVSAIRRQGGGWTLTTLAAQHHKLVDHRASVSKARDAGQLWSRNGQNATRASIPADAGSCFDAAAEHYSPDDSAYTATLFLGTLGTANLDNFVQLTFAKYCHVPRYAIFENIAAPAARHLRHFAASSSWPDARSVALMQPFCSCEGATGANLPWVFSPRSVPFCRDPQTGGAR